MAKYFTADLHFSDPFVAAIRGHVRQGWIKKEYQRSLENYGLRIAMVKMREWIQKNGIRTASIADIEGHNKQIIDNINSALRPKDQLWVVGDLMGRQHKSDIEEISYWLNQINVLPERRVLVLGNHDVDRDVFYKDLFRTVKSNSTVNIEGRLFKVSHYPYRQDLGNIISDDFRALALEDDLKTPLIFGHIHGTNRVHHRNSRAIHVGLDAWGLRPVHESEISSLARFGLMKGKLFQGNESASNIRPVQKLFSAG